MSLIEISHLRKEYPGSVPLRDVNLSVEEGDVVSIIGPSGTGKSTLLRCLNRLEEPTSGRVLIDGDEVTDPACDVARVRQKVGMVFQSFNLFDNLDALGNVCAAPMRVLGVSEAEARRRGLELLERVGLAEKATSFPDELSGGQQQRVAIARAVAMRPKVLLLDEPTSALDPTMVGEVLAVIRALAREGMTMMIVTHEMRFCRSVSTKVVYLDEGVVLEEGTPEHVFEHPIHERCRQFVRRLKTLDCTIESPTADFVALVSRLERFGFDTAIPQATVADLTLVFEELIFQILMPAARSGACELPIEVTVEHAETTGEVTLTLTWDGASFDELSRDEELSLSIVRGVSRRVRSGSTGRHNQVTVVF